MHMWRAVCCISRQLYLHKIMQARHDERQQNRARQNGRHILRYFHVGTNTTRDLLSRNNSMQSCSPEKRTTNDTTERERKERGTKRVTNAREKGNEIQMGWLICISFVFCLPTRWVIRKHGGNKINHTRAPFLSLCVLHRHRIRNKPSESYIESLSALL